MADPVIALERVTLRYPTAPRPTLRDISFRVEPGEFVGIVGSTGSGKSTLLYLRSEEHTSELQSLTNLVCRLLLEKKNKIVCSLPLQKNSYSGIVRLNLMRYYSVSY